MLKPDLSKIKTANIKVIGVGGEGTHIVNLIYNNGNKNIDFIAFDSNKEVLDVSPIPTKIQLAPIPNSKEGYSGLTGLSRFGAINISETIEDIFSIAEMTVIVSALGGETGTRVVPLVAEIAKKKGIFTIVIVSLPFIQSVENRRTNAEKCLLELQSNVDILIVIDNEKLLDSSLPKTTNLSNATIHIRNAITTILNVIRDADLRDYLKDSGSAVFVMGIGNGDKKVVNALNSIMNSPLLQGIKLSDASNIILNTTCNKDDVTMDEFGEIADFIQDKAGQNIEIIQGYGIDDELEDEIVISLIATGYDIGMKKHELLRKLAGGGIIKESESDIEKIITTISKKTNPISLYFLEDEYTKEEIAEIISNLSDIYREIGGDKLIIEGLHSYEYRPIFETLDT